MWIISAIVLNGIPIAALLRPLEGTEVKSNRKRTCNGVKKEGEVTLLENGAVEVNDESKSQCCDVSSMFDFELLKSPTFIVYGLSCFLCMLGEYNI